MPASLLGVWLFMVVAIQYAAGKMPSVRLSRAVHASGLVAAVGGMLWAATSGPWWFIVLCGLLAARGLYGVWAAGLRARDADADEIERQIAASVDAGRETFSVMVRDDGAVRLFLWPWLYAYRVRDECPHCFVERQIRRLPGRDASPVVTSYRRKLRDGEQTEVHLRQSRTELWRAELQPVRAARAVYRPDGCSLHRARAR